MAKGGTEKAWRKRPSTILWMLSLGQLISWGLVYYTFPLFVVPMTQELGWSRSGMFGALSAGLMVAGLCSIPVGAWIDRGHGRMLMTGGSLLAAALMLVWSRIDSLPLFYAMWIGLGACQAVRALRAGLRRHHPGLRAALQAGDPADDVPRRPRQHLRHSLHAVPDRAHRLAAEPGGAGRHQRARGLDPLAVHSRPAGEAGADRRGQAVGRRHGEEEPACGGGARAGLLGAGRGLRGLRARLLGDELPSDPAARRSRRADRRGDGHHRPDRAHAGGGPRAADGRPAPHHDHPARRRHLLRLSHRHGDARRRASATSMA